MVSFSLLHLNGTLRESRWIFLELLKSAPSASLPTSTSGTLNIRDRGARAPSVGFSPIAFTYFGVAMRTFMPAIVLPNIWNQCATPFPAKKFGDARSSRCVNRRLASVHQRIRPRSRPFLGQAARGLCEHVGDATLDQEVGARSREVGEVRGLAQQNDNVNDQDRRLTVKLQDARSGGNELRRIEGLFWNWK
jgi:hypothetical protein